jgi:hypothetical protein
MSITKLSELPQLLPPEGEESYCFCNDEISLQMISGGGAPEGYRGRITLLLDDDVYIDYIRKDLHDTVVVENKAVKKANIDCVDHFNAVLEDLKLAQAKIEAVKINYQMLHDFAAQHKISYVDLFVMVEKATGIQQPLR